MDGLELGSFAVLSVPLALGFAEEDRTLRVATKETQLLEWDLEQQDFIPDEPRTWKMDLEEKLQWREPTLAAFGNTRDLLCVIYRGEDLILWECLDNRIYDVYEKNTGSIALYGKHKLGEGSTTVSQGDHKPRHRHTPACRHIRGWRPRGI